jgi:hypothetical protein
MCNPLQRHDEPRSDPVPIRFREPLCRQPSANAGRVDSRDGAHASATAHGRATGHQHPQYILPHWRGWLKPENRSSSRQPCVKLASNIVKFPGQVDIGTKIGDRSIGATVSNMKDETLDGIAPADARAAIDELGPADGTAAKVDALLARTMEIALNRRAEEAGGRPFRFLGRTIVREN